MKLFGVGLKSLERQIRTIERRLEGIAFQATRCADASGELMHEEVELQAQLIELLDLQRSTRLAKAMPLAA